ncbi:MAG: hypothetical protein ACP5D9_02830 [Mariniphaga sp.]
MNKLICMLSFLLLMCSSALAQVKYDEGRIQLLGVQFLQDRDNPNEYYYLPQYPSLSVNNDGDVELMCIKYVGEDDQPSGGLFHALIQFTLPAEVLEELQAAMEEKVPGAEIMGSVPLQPLASEEGEGTAGFTIVSSVLTDTEGEEALTRSVITSGHAPLLPGSKSAIAANLTPEGATLLWNSFTGATSDVSASINACYEASVKAYNAVVSAEMNVVYDHFSTVFNYQEGYTRRQLRNVVDDLQRAGNIKVEVFDRSKGIGIKSTEMEGILNVVTDKLIEVMFNTETGWSKAPEKETAVEVGQIKGRQSRGWITKLFKGTGNQKYLSDDQYVLKKRTDIHSNSFYLNLSKETTIKVPLHSSGNLGGFYEELGDNEKYFRIVDLNDPAFQYREVFFQIDGEYVDAFSSKINFVSVNFQKKYDFNPAVNKSIIFNYQDVENGEQIKSVSFPRLGADNADWLDYEYRLSWSVRGFDDPVKIPESEEKWIKSNEPVVSLKPPFNKMTVEVDADRSMFKDAGIVTAIVEFASTLMGKTERVGRVRLGAEDAESVSKLVLYHDEGEQIAYRVTWVSKYGTEKTPVKALDSDYLYLFPPVTDDF